MKSIRIAGQDIEPGKRYQLDIAGIRLHTDTDIAIPVTVMRAKREGPTVFVSAAIHGDELNGIEIIRRLLQQKALKLNMGTLILVPMVNIYGVLNQSRYMPDRRDLNRCALRLPGAGAVEVALAV